MRIHEFLASIGMVPTDEVSMEADPPRYDADKLDAAMRELKLDPDWPVVLLIGELALREQRAAAMVRVYELIDRADETGGWPDQASRDEYDACLDRLRIAKGSEKEEELWSSTP